MRAVRSWFVDFITSPERQRQDPAAAPGSSRAPRRSPIDPIPEGGTSGRLSARRRHLQRAFTSGRFTQKGGDSRFSVSATWTTTPRSGPRSASKGTRIGPGDIVVGWWRVQAHVWRD